MILTEIEFATIFPELMLSHRLGGFRTDQVRRAHPLVGNRAIVVPPFTFNEFALQLPRSRVIHPNIVVSQEGQLLNVNNGYLATELVEHAIPDYPLKLAETGATLDAPADWVDVRECAYVVASANYSAFLLGEIPRIELYEERIKAGLPLVLHGDVRPFHLELLTMIGLRQDNLLRVPQTSGIRAGTLFHATPTFWRQSTSYPALDFLKARLGPCALQSDRYERVYLSRSRLGAGADRPVVNETVLEQHLETQGFQILHPQDLTVAEQFEVFASADVLISPFGAAWASSIFRKPGSLSIMLKTKFAFEFGRMFQYIGEDLLVMPVGETRVRSGVKDSRAFEFTVREEDMAAIDAALR